MSHVLPDIHIMATFKVMVLEHKLRSDGTYNVKIRLTHRRKQRYISTEHYLTRKDLDKNLEIKNISILTQLYNRVDKYKQKLTTLTINSDNLDVKELENFLISENKTTTQIDFIDFCKKYLDKLYANGHIGNANKIRVTFNHLMDFIKDIPLYTDDINYNFLIRFSNFLQTNREEIRYNQFNKPVITKFEPLSDTGVYIHIVYLNQLFKAAKSLYNDEDSGIIRIAHNPFKKVEKPKKKQPIKRNLSSDIIKLIRDTPDLINQKKEKKEGLKRNDRVVLARDLFMLTFYLVGINSVDLYNVDNYKNGRINYKRTKTKSRRDDEAEISIKVEPEALPLIEKYHDKTGKRVFNFYLMYASAQNFNAAFNDGLKLIAKHNNLDVDLTSYYARHSWATIASNKCSISTDDIAICLNHVDPYHIITNIYLDKDWSKIDRANRKVLDYIKIEEKDQLRSSTDK